MPKTMPDEVLAERLSEIKVEATTKALSAERLVKIKRLSRSTRLICLMYQIITVMVAVYAVREYWSAITAPEAVMNAFVKPLYWLVGLTLMQKTLKIESQTLFTPMFGRRLRWLGQWIILAMALAHMEVLIHYDKTAVRVSGIVDIFNSVSWGTTVSVPLLLGTFFTILGLMMEEAAKLKAENDLVV